MSYCCTKIRKICIKETNTKLDHSSYSSFPSASAIRVVGQLSSLVQVECEEDNVDMIHTRSLEYPVGLTMAIGLPKPL